MRVFLHAIGGSLAGLTLILAFGCGGSGGGGGGALLIGTPGTACTPGQDSEVCVGAARIQCDASLSVWTQIAVCGSGGQCIATGPGKTACSNATVADAQGGDSQGSDATAVPPSDVGGGKDTVAAGPDASSDVPAPDVSPADAAIDQTAGDAQPLPTGIMTIEAVQKASASCPSPDPDQWGLLPGVTLQNVVVVTQARKLNADGSLIGMFVQEAAGQWTGLFLIGPQDGALGALKLGDLVDVTGDVKDFYCLTEMFVTAATTKGVGMMPQFAKVTTYLVGDSAGNAKSEAWEGSLVELSDLVASGDALGSDGKPHGDFFVGLTASDHSLRVGAGFPGVFVSDKLPDGTFTPKYPKGTLLGKVRGVIDYNFGTYRLLLTEDPTGVSKP